MQASTIYSVSPSFNSYSSEKLTEIAKRVVEEFNQEQHDFCEVDYHSTIFDWDKQDPEKTSHIHVQKQENPEAEDNDNLQEYQENDDKDDDEFEFFVDREQDESPRSADEIFYNGQIKPIYPVFNKNILLYQDGHNLETQKDTKISSTSQQTVRLPLRKLFREEKRETTTSTTNSCSSSDDELEGVQPGTYCVWKPKADQEQCKKSNSTGSSSKRWKFKDLMHRSNSDGKETFVFLTPLCKKTGDKEKKENCDHCKKKSYFPYKHDILGLFSNVNGFSRNLHPF